MKGHNSLKKKITRIISVVLFTALLIGGIEVLGEVLRPVNTDIVFNAIDSFHSMPEESIEVLCCGSSRMWRGLDTMEMNRKYGLAAYNYGSNWQKINTTELFLDDALRTQSPKVVLIEASRINKVLQDSDVNGEIYCTRGLPESKEKKRYLEQCFGDDSDRWLSYYVPLFLAHENWDSLEMGHLFRNKEDPDYAGTMGFNATYESVSVQYLDPSRVKQKELRLTSVQVLDRIVETCRENGASLVFYTSPCATKVSYSDAMKQYAAEHGCTYLNLMENLDEIGIDPQTDFADKKHLNAQGAGKVADYLGKYITEHYDV